ncbi:MAG: tRNA pseudouridine(38-40) synthase TruA [Chloroflexi bacterium]|nr:tRNA pseudouridine(38-40) synthase TruA [Chloroflexota bacterium]MBI3742547.1 tRNA pseudouridine(38-40) synthase TruA [Chloroflexota bacterium]
MRLLATLEYDGTDFRGFQFQKRGRTVQGEIETALTHVTRDKTRVVGAGRTDSGVHAIGQAAHFDTTWQRSLAELQRALNAVLPNDIAVVDLKQVAENFSARYAATSRLYRYTILNQAQRAPLVDRFALIVPEPLDENAMDRAARLLIGEKDFGAFGTAPEGTNTVRVVTRAHVQRAGARVWFEIEANAFLYRMVRRIVGSLLKVGKGRQSVADFQAVLEKKRRAEIAARPNGLCLMRVQYNFSPSRENENILS